MVSQNDPLGEVNMDKEMRRLLATALVAMALVMGMALSHCGERNYNPHDQRHATKGGQ